MALSLVCIYVGGTLSLLMAIFHSRFYKLFKWNIELRKISLANQRILYTVHLALLLLLLVFVLISFAFAEELSECEGLACGISLSYSLFWLWRTGWQIGYFKGKKKGRNKSLHISLIIVFALLFIVYLLPVLL